MALNEQTVLMIMGVVIVYFLFIRKPSSESFREYLDAPSVAPSPSASVVMAAPVVPELPKTVPKIATEPEGLPAAGDFASTSDNLTLNVSLTDPVNARFAKQMGEAKPKLTSSDLLPGYSNDKWFDNPNVGVRVEDANLLADAVTKVGVDTVGQTRKNPAYDIRGTIPCPKFVVSPWNNSTIEPDINLKSLY
jgi:hypothetical protein